MTNGNIYTVGGTVQAGGGIYLKRAADDILLEHCLAGEYAYILSPRQVGKSSLMVRTAEQLQDEDVRAVIIDLSAIGVELTADEWYLGILSEIDEALHLKTDIYDWWAKHAQLGATQRLVYFCRDVLLAEINERVVIFFDEIDSTLSIPFTDDFFAALRALYNARSTTPVFKRLSFVLIGVASPGDLISDPRRTPFNIGQRVELTDFTRMEASPLEAGLGNNSRQVLDWVFEWTNGHPYLTQRLCAALTSEVVEDATQVEAVVARLFFGEQGSQDNNLQFVRDMLLERARDTQGVLRLYRRVLKGEAVEDDEQSLNKSHLKLSGVVRRKAALLKISNRIYRQVFNRDWVKEHLPRFERRTVIVLSTISIVSVLLAVFGLTGWLNRIIYPPLETTWIEIPAGEFKMGSDADDALAICKQLYEPFTDQECSRDWFTDEEPIHTVYLDTYQIEAYEVTNRQYAQCVKAGVCQGGGYTFEDQDGNIINRLDDPAYADHPVVSVDWFQAQTYCEWIGGRLPTEAEWEKAARGNDGHVYPWGDEFDGSRTNFCDSNCSNSWANTNVDDGYTATAPIGSYPQGVSSYGVYDMAGNVWEWTADWYDSDYYESAPANNPAGPEDGSSRVLRGGSWNVYANVLRAAYRSSFAPSSTYYYIGFRCARSP